MKYKQKVIMLLSDTNEECGNTPLIHTIRTSKLESDRDFKDSAKLPNEHRINLRQVNADLIFNE